VAEYGSIDTVKKMLRATEGATFGDDADLRLTALKKHASRIIEHETGRVFGVDADATPTTEYVVAPGVSPILILPRAIRTVTSVTEGGSWDGSDYAGGSLLATSYYRPTYRMATGEYGALVRPGGSFWSGTVKVVGVWEDADSDTDVPDDITYAANVMIAEWFKVERASPAGFTGPDGATVPVRKVLADERVKTVLAYYRASPMLLAV
jgi:hypothetical protein